MNDKGFALEATIFVMVLMSVLILAAFNSVVAVTRTANVDYRNSRVSYAAEAGADAVMAQLADALEDGAIDDVELATVEAPEIEGFTFDHFEVNRVGGIQVETITDGAFAGLYSLTQRVEITSRALDDMNNASEVLVSAKAQAIPIFQFGIFYEKDLEATNGPAMEFAGWVHSNGNIYLSSANAWYRDVITTPNKIFHDRKDSHSVLNGVYIDNAAGTEVMLDFDSRTHPTANEFRGASNLRFNDRLKTDAYGVDSLRVPLPAGMDPIEVVRPREASDTEIERKAKFAWKADLYVIVDLTTIRQKSAICGAATPNPTDPWPDIIVQRPAGMTVPSQAELCAMFQWRWSAFYDGREKVAMDVIDLDVAQLGAWVGVNPAKRSQIVYVEFRTPASLAAYSAATMAKILDGKLNPAFRLVNGSVLPNRMSIATHYPLYVRGDFNRNAWQPAALVGDAISILSNGWDDAQHVALATNKTNAQDTQVWGAILAGHSATPCDHEAAGCAGGYEDFYGGGIENYPRFLENWSGKTLTYRGSLVSLHTSTIAVGTWNGSYYSPPKRDWQFDTRFEDPQNLPPGTPMVGNVIHTAFPPVY